MPEGQDRRAYSRAPVSGEARGSIYPGGEVRVINLSAGGAMIEHVGRVAVGGVCILSLRLNGLDCRLPGRAVWSHPHRAEATPPDAMRFAFRSGLSFLRLPADTERDLRRYLASVGVA